MIILFYPVTFPFRSKNIARRLTPRSFPLHQKQKVQKDCREVDDPLFPSSREDAGKVTSRARGVASADAKEFCSAEVSQARLAPTTGPFVSHLDAPHLWSAATVCVCVRVCVRVRVRVYVRVCARVCGQLRRWLLSLRLCI